MKPNVMYSGTAGTVKPHGINAHLDSLTIVKLVFVCGPIKYQNAEMKVSLANGCWLNSFLCLLLTFYWFISTKHFWSLSRVKYTLYHRHRIYFTFTNLAVSYFSEIISSPKQKLPEDLHAPPQVKFQMLDLSHDMPIQKIAVNTTFVSKVQPVNMVAPLEPSSKLVTQMVQATVKTQKMFPDGKLIEIYLNL